MPSERQSLRAHPERIHAAAILEGSPCWQVPYDAHTWNSGPFSVTRMTSVSASPAASGPR